MVPYHFVSIFFMNIKESVIVGYDIGDEAVTW